MPYRCLLRNLFELPALDDGDGHGLEKSSFIVQPYCMFTRKRKRPKIQGVKPHWVTRVQASSTEELGKLFRLAQVSPRHGKFEFGSQRWQ